MKVIKNYFYNAGYQILLMLVPLITVPYISRVLGPYESGINSYTNSFVTFFYLAGQLGITLYGNRQIAYFQNDKFKRSVEFWSIISLQLVTSAFALLFYLLIILELKPSFQKYYFFQSLWIISTGLDVSWYFMGIEDFKKTVVRNMIVKIITIFCIFIFVRSKSDLGLYILLLGIAQIFGSLTLWPYLKKNVVRVPLDMIKPFKHFYPALLLFIPTITSQVYLVINRLMLGSMSNQTELGQFDYSDKIVKLILAVVTASGTVMMPHIANKYAKNDYKGINNSLYNSFDFVSALSIPLMFGVMAIAIEFAPWFLGNQYKYTGYIIMFESPIIFIISWSVVSGMQYLVPVKRVREYTASVIIGAVVNVIFNILLISLYSAIGAAIATVISELVITTVQLYFMRDKIVIKKIFNGIWKYILSGLIMYIVVKWINFHFTFTIISFIVEVAIGVVVYSVCLLVLRAKILYQIKKLKNGFL